MVMTTPTSTNALVATSKAKLPAILTSLIPARAPERTQVVDLPKTVTITPEVAAAVDGLSLQVSRTTPALTVTSRRALTQAEIDMLSDERRSIDVLKKYLDARLEAHRSMMMNHFDCVLEADGVPADADQDDKGHWVVAAEVPTSDGAKKWVAQVSGGKPVLTAEALEEQIGQHGDAWTREDYLACTTAVRVLDEEKALLHLRKKDAITAAWRAAISVGKKTASLYHR